MAETLRRHHSKPPLQGHHFPQSEHVLLKADSVEALLAEMVRYRANNALSLGDPEGELLAHYKKVAPHYVTRVGGPRLRPVFPGAEALMRASRSAPALLPANDDLVKARRNVCAGCSWRQDAENIDAEPTHAYVKAARRRGILMLHEATVTAPGFCMAHGQWCALLTRMLDPHAAETLKTIPVQCWVEEK